MTDSNHGFGPTDLFDMGQTDHAELFRGAEYGWGVLVKISGYIASHIRPGFHGRCEGVPYISNQVFIGDGTVVEHGAVIEGPAIIGNHCRIRANAYIRGGVIIGDNCVVGHASELKNSLLFNGSKVPHRNYVGDSVLGANVHLGAGVVLSNVKLVPGTITLAWGGGSIATGLHKFGSLLGDGVQIGCNSVLNPGSIVGRGSIIGSLVNWRGYLEPGKLVRNRAPTDIINLESQRKG